MRLSPALHRLRSLAWLLPLLLAALFVATTLLWAQANERADREAERQTLIADALSTEAQLRALLDAEQRQLAELAAGVDTPEELAADPRLQAGLQRLWLSLTWLDADLRVRAQLPAAPLPNLPATAGSDAGLSLHLVAALPEGQGQLVVRYAPALLLKRGVPWWLSRKYAVRLVDSADTLIASLDAEPVRAEPGSRPSYRVTLSGPLRSAALTPELALADAALELTLREPAPPLLRPLVLVLMAGFLLLSAAASALLRRHMRRAHAAEAAWRTEAAWRRAMEDSALVGLRARDLQGRHLAVNRRFCELVGWPAEALLGQGAPMPYWPADGVDEALQRHRRNLAGNAPPEGYEARWQRRDGRLLDVFILESPLRDASGRQTGWMGSILDITAQKQQAEREARQAEAQAQTARLTMLGEVAATLAHELNQPLTAIASYGAGVQNSLQRLGLADASVQTALTRLGEQAAQAGRVVQRIRQFLTRREAQCEPAEVNALLRDAARLAERSLQRAGCQLQLQLAEGLPPVRADAVLVEQVLLNLLRNAAEAGAARLLLVTQQVGSFVRVDLHDDGPGLQGRRPEQLFAPFYSHKPEGVEPGMGMGLAICRSLVEAQQGVLDAGDSALLGGARFSFSLPVEAPSHD